MDIFRNRKLSDSELVALIIEDDHKAFKQLFLRYYSVILFFVKGIVKNKDVAEDITQDIFIRLWAGRKRLDIGKSIKNYLYVASRNEIINYFKSKYTSTKPISDKMTEIPSGDSSENRIFYIEQRELYLKAIDRMPYVRQKVFKMSRMENLKNQDIAEKLGISVRTVEKHIQLALKDLHENLS